MVPNLRYLSSMRARITAGFVFILAPLLLAVSAIVPIIANRVTEMGDRSQYKRLAKQTNEILTEPNWQAHLSEIGVKIPPESAIALLIVNQDGTLVWRSPGRGPAWPGVAQYQWRKSMLQAEAATGSMAFNKRLFATKLAQRPLQWPEQRPEEEHRAADKAEATATAGTRNEERGTRSEKDASPGSFLAPHSSFLSFKAAGKLPEWVAKPEDDWRVVANLPVGPESRPMVLVIFQSVRDALHARVLQKLELLLLSLFAIFAVAGGAWLLVGQTLSPIRRLANQAGAASVENLQFRLKTPSRDAEVVDLVDTLNGLLSRLAETAEVKGRFYAAASHELRTPLQALSGHLEVALSRGRTADEYETFLQEASKQAGRLTSLVQDLLLLHQLDSTLARPQEPVDLAEVCDGVLSHLTPLIDARELRLNADLTPGAIILAVPTHAEILIRNLVENAVKYAVSGGAVTLSLTSDGAGTRLELFNECAPVPGWNPQKLFEPFYRPDAARNAKTGGNGLGLAICRAVATANVWTLELRQEPRGVRVTVEFGPARSG
jgi:signal transduction histidine kinase